MSDERECRKLLESCTDVLHELVDEMIEQKVSTELVHKAGWVLSEIHSYLRKHGVSGEK